MPDPVNDHNRRAWDALVRQKQRFTRPAPDEELHDPLGTVDGVGWLADGVRGKRLLCLAAGGGRQSALYAAAGAEVTVVDISPAMLALDREVAAERGLAVRTIEASMDDLSALADRSFDLVVQPVSTCYVPNVLAVYREVARVCAPGAIYVSQHKQPASLQAEVQPSPRGYELVEPYYRAWPGESNPPLRPVAGTRFREDGTLEFLHRWEELIGGLCRSGFVVEDLLEPFHAERHTEPGSFAHRCWFVAPYLRIKARRVAGHATESPRAPRVWMPEL